MLKRQTVISQMYQQDRLVVEGGISVRRMKELLWDREQRTDSVYAGQRHGRERRHHETKGYWVCFPHVLPLVKNVSD